MGAGQGRCDTVPQKGGVLIWTLELGRKTLRPIPYKKGMAGRKGRQLNQIVADLRRNYTRPQLKTEEELPGRGSRIDECRGRKH